MQFGKCINSCQSAESAHADMGLKVLFFVNRVRFQGLFLPLRSGCRQTTLNLWISNYILSYLVIMYQILFYQSKTHIERPFDDKLCQTPYVKGKSKSNQCHSMAEL